MLWNTAPTFNDNFPYCVQLHLPIYKSSAVWRVLYFGESAFAEAGNSTFGEIQVCGVLGGGGRCGKNQKRK